MSIFVGFDHQSDIKRPRLNYRGLAYYLISVGLPSFFFFAFTSGAAAAGVS